MDLYIGGLCIQIVSYIRTGFHDHLMCCNYVYVLYDNIPIWFPFSSMFVSYSTIMRTTIMCLCCCVPINVCI